MEVSGQRKAVTTVGAVGRGEMPTLGISGRIVTLTPD